MNPIAPLTNESGSWPDARSASGGRITSFLEGSTELAKSFPSAGTERSECLLLHSIRKDRNYQIPSQLGRRSGMEELLPEIAQGRFAQSRQGGNTLFNWIRHRKTSQPDIDASFARTIK
jgi:hypothetical protein